MFKFTIIASSKDRSIGNMELYINANTPGEAVRLILKDLPNDVEIVKMTSSPVDDEQ
jgi:hypothetical protein